MALIADSQRPESLAAIREIASGVAHGAIHAADDSDSEVVRRRRRPNGFAGLFHAYADSAGVIPDGMETCSAIVEHCLDLETHPQNLGLFGGWAGLGWIASHLDSDDDFVGTHAERLLIQALHMWPRARGYDLISGLVGAGVFFYERLPRESAVRGLTMVLANLEATSVETDEGTAWFTEPEFLPAWQREYAPNGYFNLGVAHGVPGVCWLLGKLCLARVERDRAELLLGRSLRWLRSQQPNPDRPELPSWTGPGVERAPNRRMAWCYGPLGAAAVALEAAKVIGDEEGSDWALTLALSCAEVPPAEARVQDAGLCHGAAGNVQMFHRLYRNFEEAAFHTAALRWFEATLTHRRPGEGVGGYRMWGEVETNRQGWLHDASFLSGSGGVGLALLSAVTDVDPNWDRLLLLS